MPEMAADPRTLAAIAAALALTLVLAAWLTPRSWWRRLNLRALAVLAGGTLALGALFVSLLGPRSHPAPLTAPVSAAARPAPGARYLAVDGLNLRDGNGVRARRVAVLRAGTTVVATGAVDGDWWQVRARVDGQAREGWASSLWLRRADELRSAPGASGCSARSMSASAPCG
jgi:hypothetical protein